MSARIDPESLPPEEQAWRPASGHDVILRDRELAKLGLQAQLEAQAKSGVMIAIKGLESLSFDEWLAIERQQFGQLMSRLKKASSGVDDRLTELVEDLDAAYEAALVFRNQHLHGLWSWNVDHGGPSALDMKRNQKLHVSGIDEGLQLLGALTFKTKACAMRAAELIQQGLRPRRTEDRGPNIKVKGEWIPL